MDSFQGTLLDPQGQTRYEGLAIYSQPHTAPDGSQVWSGYFELPTAEGVITGETFRLALDDGREWDIRILSVEPLDEHTPRVLFETTGLQR